MMFFILEMANNHQGSVSHAKSIIDDLGLKAKSSHVLTGWAMPENVGTMTNDWERTVADAAELGQSHIACAYLFDSERESIDDYKKLSDLLNSLLSQCDVNLVKFELDLYWTARAGVDPVEYFKNNEGRFPLWHVKDMGEGEEQFFSAVGEGVIDWQRILIYLEI